MASRLQQRREENRRKNIRATIIFTVLLIVLILFLLHRWYVSIHSDYWEGRDIAVAQAVYAADLEEVSQAKMFNGERPWFIVNGKDEAGEDWIVWVSEEEIVVRQADEGISQQEAESFVMARSGPVSIIHTIPGVWRNELCWEIYYTKIEPDGEIYYYDYVRFADGEHIETLRLGK